MLQPKLWNSFLCLSSGQDFGAVEPRLEVTTGIPNAQKQGSRDCQAKNLENLLEAHAAEIRQERSPAGHICLTPGQRVIYVQSSIHLARSASGRRRSGQTKRSAAVLQDSAGSERTNPSGELKPGELMPSEQEISARLGVSGDRAPTLKSLCSRGLAFSQRGRGTSFRG